MQQHFDFLDKMINLLVEQYNIVRSSVRKKLATFSLQEGAVNGPALRAFKIKKWNKNEYLIMAFY